MSLNWGDKESAEALALQLRELLRDRTMTFAQLGSCYSIKHGQSVTTPLLEISSEKHKMSLADFVAHMADVFEIVDQKKVRRRLEGAAEASVAQLCGGGPPAAVRSETSSSSPLPMLKYADVARGLESILKELKEPISVEALEDVFQKRFATSLEDIAGMTTGEYLQKKEKLFEHDLRANKVSLKRDRLASPEPPMLETATARRSPKLAPTLIAPMPKMCPSLVNPRPDPPMPDRDSPKDEALIVREFEQLVQATGPIVNISTLNAKFLKRNGVSVVSVLKTRPLEVCKMHPDIFHITDGGDITLQKLRNLQDKPETLGDGVTQNVLAAQATTGNGTTGVTIPPVHADSASPSNCASAKITENNFAAPSGPAPASETDHVTAFRQQISDHPHGIHSVHQSGLLRSR